jgi:hypothetical protein
MSKHNNVNPGQYKVAGRNRLGDPLPPSREKMRAQETQRPRAKKKASTPRAR